MTSIYSKSSFDRFGDDLCEDILSYFPLEDGIKFECVSQQWKRTAYQRVHILERGLIGRLLSEKQLERGVPGLESLLKKCQNIRHILIYYLPMYLVDYPQLEDTILEMICKYCPNLKSINNHSFGFKPTIVDSIGHKLQTIHLFISKNNFEKLIGERFPSLRRLDINLRDDLKIFDQTDQDNFSIKRLTHLKFNCSDNEEDFLRTIIRNNKQLKSLDLFSSSYYSFTSEEVLTELSDLTQLESLAIRLSIGMESIDTILEKIRIIGQNCPKLKKLSLIDSGGRVHLRLMWLTVIEYYPNLVSFAIESCKNRVEWFEEPNMSCDLLANCPNLQHLSLDIPEMSHTFFEDIHKYVPKLRHLSTNNMKTNEVIIDFLAKLPELQTFVLKYSHSMNPEIIHRIDHVHLSKLFRNCTRLKSVYLTYDHDKFKLFRNYFGSITKFCQSPNTWFQFNETIE